MTKYLIAVSLVLIPIALSASGYGVLLYADNRYVQQQQWIQENRATELRRIQYRIDELEWKIKKGQAGDKDLWELKRLKSEKAQIERR